MENRTTQEGTKIVANRFQNRAKNNKKSKSHSPGELGAPRGWIFPLSPRNIATNLEPKIHKKRNKNIIKVIHFSITALIRKMNENRCPNHSKIDSKMYQNQSRKEAERKNTRSVKTNNPPSFLLYFPYLRESENLENPIKNAFENDLNFEWDFGGHFLWMLVDLGTILGSKIEQKSNKNDIKKQSDFQTKL